MQKAKKSSKADKIRLKRKQAFGKAISILGLTERAVADLLGVPYSKINNILRGNSSVDESLAYQIQAATGISAESLMEGVNPPLMINGTQLSAEEFNNWKELPISEEDKRNQIEEIALMGLLLLETAELKGSHERRRTYFLLKGMLEEARIQSGITLTEVHDTARMAAQITTYQTSRDELDRDIGASPVYQSIREQLSSKGQIEVTKEEFSTWPDTSTLKEVIPDQTDSMRVERHIYRIRVEGKMYEVRRNRFTGSSPMAVQKAKKMNKAIGKANPYIQP